MQWVRYNRLGIHAMPHMQDNPWVTGSVVAPIGERGQTGLTPGRSFTRAQRQARAERRSAPVEGRPNLSLVNAGLDEIFDAVAEEWQERALCAQTDPEAFFPEKGGSTREAKRICLGCEVRDECLEYALANDERFGIWGGLSERERRRLKRGVV